MPDAGTLSCPQCGAAAAPDATACAFCRARLATVACPACFGLVFVGSRHCAHCGARAREPRALDGTPWRCPSGHGELRGISIGGAVLGECATCAGLWIDELTFQAVVSERTRPMVVPQGGSEDARRRTIHETQIRYRPCCDCGKMMNRVNFAKSSGIVLDACKSHGLWCDADELRAVVEFVRGGGLEAARQRLEEKRELDRRRDAFMQRLEGVHEPARQTLAPTFGDRTREEPPVASLFLSLFFR
jgi:Zn-finger nucleic acid-binding protein